jgi:PAS domain S-box-containing protein
MTSRPLPYLASVIALAAAYFGAAKLGLSLASVAEQVTVVWPPTGIALAALLLLGKRLWPGVALGAFLANLTAHAPPPVAAGIAVGNTLEAVVGAELLHRLVGFRNTLDRLQDVLGLVTLAAGLSTMVSATVGVTSLCLGGLQQWSAFGALWQVWWLGDAMGNLVLAPALLTWAAWPLPGWQPRRAAEAAVLLVGLAEVSAIVFAGGNPRQGPGHALEYTIFPFVIWAALRFGPRAWASVALVALTVAILGTVHGSGPFSGGAVHENLVQLHLYMAVVAVTALLLGVVMTERRKAESRRAVGYAATEVLAESASLPQAAPRLLRVICESLDCDVGALWSVDRQANVLRCVEVWQHRRAAAAPFEEATRRLTFAPGVGLPGRVWGSGRPAWIADVTRDANFPRAPIAAGAGLHSAFAFPIVLGAEVFGAIEFFSRRIEPPDEDLLELLAAVGGQIGLFLERKRAEEALRDSEERFRTLADSIPQLAWIARPDGHILWYNQRWYDYTGTTFAQMQGWGWRAVHDAADLPRVLANWKDALEKGQPWEDTFLLRRRDGAMRWHLSRAVPVRDTGGRVARWFGTNTDITERMEMERALKEADRRKDEFLATLAHELRNPLAPIRTALEILRLRQGDAAAFEHVRGMMERQVGHMVRLVDDLLDLSRISRGKIALRRERLDLAEVVRVAVETSRPLLEAARHELAVALPPEPVGVEGDLTRLAQVLANLLNNAAKYTPEAGRIDLRVAREGGQAVVRVRDSGVGIPADMLPRVFEMFTQVEHGGGRAQGGLGIGLTLVRGLVEMHGGAVEAHSDGPGKGSEFVVRLPLAPKAPRGAGAAERPGNGPPAAAAPSRRILVVDDNVDSAESLGMLLKLMGNEVALAYDGPSALQTAAALVPDLVLLDLGMPGMDGFEVARRLRALPQLRAAVLVAQTGWAQEEDRRQSREAGFHFHLVKPVDPQELARLVALANDVTTVR